MSAQPAHANMDPANLEAGQNLDFAAQLNDVGNDPEEEPNQDENAMNGPHGCIEWALCLVCMLILAPFYCLYLFISGLYKFAKSAFVKYRDMLAKATLTKPVRKFDPTSRRESIALDMMSHASNRADAQAASGFISRFPPEIREIIYGYALGGQNFHVLHGRKRMAGLPCIETYPLTYEDRVAAVNARPGINRKLKENDPYCRNLPRRWDDMANQFLLHFECVEPFVDRKTMLVKNEAYRAPMKGHSRHERMALIKSCKFIYNEAIDILYAKNTFLFHHPQDLILFASTIPPSRLRQIKTIGLLLSGSVPVKSRFTSADVRRDLVPVLDKMTALENIRIVPNSRMEDSSLVSALLSYGKGGRAAGTQLKIKVNWAPGMLGTGQLAPGMTTHELLQTLWQD